MTQHQKIGKKFTGQDVRTITYGKIIICWQCEEEITKASH
jgi:hypothetical protein